jgi:hypothetical protein
LDRVVHPDLHVLQVAQFLEQLTQFLPRVDSNLQLLFLLHHLEQLLV